jgi:hypothetical protein
VVAAGIGAERTGPLLGWTDLDAVLHAVAGREDEFVTWVVAFAHDYAARRSAPTTRSSSTPSGTAGFREWPPPADREWK